MGSLVSPSLQFHLGELLNSAFAFVCVCASGIFIRHNYYYYSILLGVLFFPFSISVIGSLCAYISMPRQIENVGNALDARCIQFYSNFGNRTIMNVSCSNELATYSISSDPFHRNYSQTMLRRITEKKTPNERMNERNGWMDGKKRKKYNNNNNNHQNIFHFTREIIYRSLQSILWMANVYDGWMPRQHIHAHNLCVYILHSLNSEWYSLSIE